MVSFEIPDDDALRAILAAVESLLPSPDRWETPGSYASVGLAVIAAIAITVDTPITTPRIVSPERSLFARSVSTAIETLFRTFSPNIYSCLNAAIGSSSAARAAG